MLRRAVERRPDPSADGATSRRSSRLGRILAVLTGAGIVGLLVWYTGVGPIVERLRALGAYSPLILLPYAVIAWCDTRGWRCALPAADADRVPGTSLYLTRMAGQALNSIVPAATVGGEGVKAYMLRRWGVSGPNAIASLVIARTALMLSQALFVVIGIGALFIWLGRPVAGAVWFTLLLVALIALSRGLVHLQRQGPAQAVWRLVHRIAPRARIVDQLRDRAAVVDERLDRFYTLERGAFRRSTSWSMLGWALGVTEVMLIMALIDSPVPFGKALIIESLAQVVRASALVVPAAIGTQELGGVGLCTFLDIPTPAAVTLWLLKRARELVFDVVGMLYLARHTTRGTPARKETDPRCNLGSGPDASV